VAKEKGPPPTPCEQAEKMSGEFYEIVDGRATDARLHAEILGEDLDDCVGLRDLPDGATEQDYETARQLFAERLRKSRQQQAPDKS
jgi:hypothetical protein